MCAQKVSTEIRQEQIAQAALDLVGSQGLQALSIAAVAERVGLVPSAIYRHFKSKDDVLDAMLALIEKRLMGNVILAREEAVGALDRLHKLLARHVRLFAENQAIPTVVFSESIFSASSNRKARVRKIITGYLMEIEKIINEGRAAGQLRKDVDPPAAARMFIGIILPAVIVWKVTEGGIDLEQHAAAAWKLFCAAVSATGQATGRS